MPVVSVNSISKAQSFSIGPSVPERSRGCFSITFFSFNVFEGFVASCAITDSFPEAWASEACVPVVTFCVADGVGMERIVALDKGFDDAAVIERMEPAGTSTSRVAARGLEPPPMY